MDGVIKEVKMGMGRMGVRFQGEGREWKLPGLLYSDYLDLYGESEEGLKAIVERFVRFVGKEV